MASPKTYPVFTYSVLEERINVWSHFAGILFSIVALVLLMMKAFRFDDLWTYISFPIYGISMLVLYLASTLYHNAKKPKIRYRLNILDHASIFLFIAGSYTPFVLVTLSGKEGWLIFSIVWTIALIGIILKIFFTGKFNILSTILYVLMGWIIVFSFGSLTEKLNFNGLIWLVSGGIAYTLGAIIYSIDRVKLNHSIFHFFVLLGSFCHFISIYTYVHP